MRYMIRDTTWYGAEYRKWILRGDIRNVVEECCKEIATAVTNVLKDPPFKARMGYFEMNTFRQHSLIEWVTMNGKRREGKAFLNVPWKSLRTG